MKTSAYIPDHLHAQATAAGLNLSATLQAALRERLNPQPGPVGAAVEALFGSLDAVSTADLADRELGLALARKVDAARWSDSASMALASASPARELRELIAEVAPHLPRHDALDDLVVQRRQRRLAELGRP